MEIKTPSGKVVATVSAADPNTEFCDEGVWIEVKADDGTRPTLCLIKRKPDEDWYLGVYRDVKKTAGACDLGLTFSKEGPILQVVKAGEVKVVNLFDLLAQMSR
jgi:hypothetical protein